MTPSVACYNLSLCLIDLSKPFVIQFLFLCLYLWNFPIIAGLVIRYYYYTELQNYHTRCIRILTRGNLLVLSFEQCTRTRTSTQPSPMYSYSYFTHENVLGPRYDIYIYTYIYIYIYIYIYNYHTWGRVHFHL